MYWNRNQQMSNLSECDAGDLRLVPKILAIIFASLCPPIRGITTNIQYIEHKIRFLAESEIKSCTNIFFYFDCSLRVVQNPYKGGSGFSVVTFQPPRWCKPYILSKFQLPPPLKSRNMWSKRGGSNFNFHPNHPAPCSGVGFFEVRHEPRRTASSSLVDSSLIYHMTNRQRLSSKQLRKRFCFNVAFKITKLITLQRVGPKIRELRVQKIINN